MTENYKDFLDWATPQITVDQYQILCKIVYSFKKYRKTDERGIFAMGKFKDEAVAICGHLPHFFAEMGKLAGDEHFRLFASWYNDNVIFWPYKETPELVRARERLMEKCETHNTHYRFLYVFRENKHGEITLFQVVNKCFAGSPLWEYSLKEYLDTLWKTKGYDDEDKSEDYGAYIKAYNTKRTFKHCLGLSNKQYKELVDKYPYYTESLTLNAYESSVYRSFSKIFDNIVKVPINAKYLLYLYYKYIFDMYGIHPEGTVFISDVIIGIAELKERRELK